MFFHRFSGVSDIVVINAHSMKISYNWLKEFFPKYFHRLGKPEELAEKFTNLGLEVTSIESFGKDTVLELEITTNRGDCLSHLGIAREIAAIYNLPLRIPTYHFFKHKGSKPCKNLSLWGEENLPFQIKIEKQAGKKPFCSRYFAQVIQDIKIASSPFWLAERLSLCGIRPINNVVDITNYVLLELGQPLHAFDYELIADRQIIVRWAKKGEKIVTLEEKEKILEEDIPVIADSEKAIALAGIIGGKDTAVNENTKNILLESAYFDPLVIRRTTKKLGIITESSYRFERGVDWDNVRYAAERAAYLLKQITQGELQTKNIDLKPHPCKLKKIKIEFKEVNNLLGAELKPKEIVSCLKRLGFPLKQKKNTLEVEIPTYRNDLTQEVDLIEEVARIYGYKNIPSTISSFRPGNSLESTTFLERKESQVEKEIRQFLLSCGLNEVINYSFLSLEILSEFGFSDKEIISLCNPLSRETTCLRTTLLPGLLHNAENNFRHQIENIKIFEIGKTYFKEGETFQEKKYLAGLLTGENRIKYWGTKPEKLNFYHLRGLLDGLFLKLGIRNYKYQEINVPYFNLGKAFKIAISEKENVIIGKIGELSDALIEKYEFRNKIHLFEINLELLVNFANLEKTHISLPKYPFIQRDLSFVVPEDIYQENIFNLVLRNGGKYLKHCELIDLYKNGNIQEGYHSLTYRLTYCNPQATLTTEEVEKSEKEIIHALEEQLGAQIRKI